MTDWTLNTNERYSRGAYRKMLDQGEIATFGFVPAEYPKSDIGRIEIGDRLFAYVNRRGVIAYGYAADTQIFPSRSVFDRDSEYHRRVTWSRIVREDRGVTVAQTLEMFDGRRYPLGCTLSPMNNLAIIEWLVEELDRRPTK